MLKMAWNNPGKPKLNFYAEEDGVLFSQKVKAFRMDTMTECKQTVEVYVGSGVGLCIEVDGLNLICSLDADAARVLGTALLDASWL